MFDLTGMTALVTGASGGLGSAIVEALVDQGARVAVSGSNAAKLQDFASGARSNDAVMASFARPLSPADMADLAAYYACLSPVGERPEKGLAAC